MLNFKPEYRLNYMGRTEMNFVPKIISLGRPGYAIV